MLLCEGVSSKLCLGPLLFGLISTFHVVLIALMVLLSCVCLWVQMKILGELKQLLRHVKGSLTWGVNWILVLLALGDRFPGNFMVSLQISPHRDYYVYAVLMNRPTIQVMTLGFWEMYVIYTKYSNMDDWNSISGTSIPPILRVSDFMV